MSFGVVSCKELIPDLWDLADRIPVALAELTDAAATAPRAVPDPAAPGPE
jgi:hypothetical protein